MEEGREGSVNGLPYPTLDPEDRVARRFGDKRLQRGVGAGIKERAGNLDLGHIVFQDRCGFCWPEFDNGYGLGMAAAAQGHLARSSGVAHPGYLAIGGDQPALTTCLDKGDRRRIQRAAASTSHGQEIGVSRSWTHMKERSHEPIEEAAPKAQAMGCGHKTLPASETSMSPCGGWQEYRPPTRRAW
jgi:hypothetical protein